MSDYLTPPAVAKLLHVRPDRVRAWIRSGQLRAVDLSDGTRPRFRISESDLQIFLNRRSAAPEPKVSRRRRRDPDVIEFF